VPSIHAATGGAIARLRLSIVFIEGEGLGLKTDPHAEQMVVGGGPLGAACPSCNSFSVQMKEGCMTCNDCGHSKCG